MTHGPAILLSSRSSPGADRRRGRSLRVPGSKSLTNRALVVAALAEGPSVLRGALDCEDTQVMVAALRALGIEVEHDVRLRP